MFRFELVVCSIIHFSREVTVDLKVLIQLSAFIVHI